MSIQNLALMQVNFLISHLILAFLQYLLYSVFEVICMTTGQRIKARRKELGISAEKLAEKLDISPATIYRYENGDIEKVPGERLAPIAEALSTTPAFLMGWEGPLTNEQQIDVYIRGAKKWATDFRFSEQQSNRIIEYLANLASKQKALVNCMADAEKADGKIVIDSTLQGIIDDLSYWASIAVKYVNEDLAYDDSPFSEDNIRDQYLSAIRKMSVEDQYRWLVRIQDFIDQNYPVKEENL